MRVSGYSQRKGELGKVSRGWPASSPERCGGGMSKRALRKLKNPWKKKLNGVTICARTRNGGEKSDGKGSPLALEDHFFRMVREES